MKPIICHNITAIIATFDVNNIICTNQLLNNNQTIDINIVP